MRTLILLSTLLAPLFVSAQERPRYDIYESSRDFLSGPANAMVMELPGVREKMAEKVWRDYFDKLKGRAKRSKEIKGHVFPEVEIYPIGGYDKMNVYYRLEESKERTTLTVWFDRKGGVLRSDEDAAAYREAVKFLEDYGLQVHISQVQEELEAEEKNLKNLEKDMDRLKRDHDGYQRDIEQARERIAKAEQQTIDNVKEQGRIQEIIRQQQDKVKEVQERIRQLQR